MHFSFEIKAQLGQVPHLLRRLLIVFEDKHFVQFNPSLFLEALLVELLPLQFQIHLGLCFSLHFAHECFLVLVAAVQHHRRLLPRLFDLFQHSLLISLQEVEAVFDKSFLILEKLLLGMRIQQIARLHCLVVLQRDRLQVLRAAVLDVQG